MRSDEEWMQDALDLARQAQDADEVPVGAIVVYNEEIIGQGYNQPITHQDPTAHAEIVALRDASRHLDNYRIPGASLSVTLEPCMMCAGAMVHARIKRLVYGAADPKTGIIDSHLQLLRQKTINHEIEVTGGVMADECGELLSAFFRNKRRDKK